MILRVEWLEKLGKVTVDWGKLTMMYRQGEKEITVKGPHIGTKSGGTQGLNKNG